MRKEKKKGGKRKEGREGERSKSDKNVGDFYLSEISRESSGVGHVEVSLLR